MPPDPVTTPPAPDDDHRLAAHLAHATARLLVEVRERLVAQGVEADELCDTGDREAHTLLLRELRAEVPGDAILSEESPGARGPADPARLAAPRVWIVDPLDGTREYGNPNRGDWAVHVALVIDHQPAAAAVALPAQRLLLTMSPAPAELPPGPDRPRIVVSRSRRPPWVDELAATLGGTVTQMGSAGAKAMSIVLGANDIYVHDAGQYEWDSAAPIGVARAAGLHTSRLDGAPLTYNNDTPRMPDLLVCRPQFADATLRAVAALRA